MIVLTLKVNNSNIYKLCSDLYDKQIWGENHLLLGFVGDRNLSNKNNK